MAVWYEVEKTEDGIANFLDSNWGFHDFRIETVSYDATNNAAEVFLKYDNGIEGVLIRFIGVSNVHINGIINDFDDWLQGTAMRVQKNGRFLCVTSDGYFPDSESSLNEFTWVESDRVIWAITDADGKPVEMPQDRIDQVWETWGKKEKKHFDLKECADV